MHICNFQSVHLNNRWPIKRAVSMHLHALKAECIISQHPTEHRIWILNSMALTMKCRRRSQHLNRAADTRWAHWVSSAGCSLLPKSTPTVPTLIWRLKILLRLVFSKICRPNILTLTKSTFFPVHFKLIWDFMQRFLTMAQDMALFVSSTLFSHARPVTPTNSSL